MEPKGRAIACPFPVVALTGSAGALPAVGEVLSRLPRAFAASVLVLVHQPPGHPSRLDDVLVRNCRLAVRSANADEQLAPGQVLVVPPGCHMVVSPGDRARLVVSGEFPPNRPSADLLLATMGVSLGDRAVAVVLSGGGRDGATGATVVHAFGGTVIAADPATAPHSSMPREAIERDEAVDYVLALPEIANTLKMIASAGHRGPPQPR